jgi:hypothetical protein
MQQNSDIHQVDPTGFNSMLAAPGTTNITNGGYLLSLTIAHCNAGAIMWGPQICQTLAIRGAVDAGPRVSNPQIRVIQQLRLLGKGKPLTIQQYLILHECLVTETCPCSLLLLQPFCSMGQNLGVFDLCCPLTPNNSALYAQPCHTNCTSSRTICYFCCPSIGLVALLTTLVTLASDIPDPVDKPLDNKLLPF